MSIKRDPSLHIKKSDLTKVLTKLLPLGVDIGGFVKILMEYAKPYSIHTRTITVSNEQLEKKAKRLVQSSRYDADLMAQLIYAIRKKMKHRGISPIKPGGRDWGVLKEITGQALDFTNEFNLTRRQGFLKYIEIGLSKMKTFTLNKFLNLYEPICERYQAMVEIEQDSDPKMTHSLYRIYATRIVENTGISDPLEGIPEKYVWFVRARKQAEELDVSISIYLKAQFEAFDFTRGIPYPSQLVGLKSTERVIRYCYQNGIRIKTNDND